ncbi:MAG: transposase [Dehalococcoidia bacterium]|nr:transposase [Dehalococcoidia bacterium]
MKYDPDKHHRRSIRLKDYDYSQAGAYFVTICIQNRECLLGDVLDGEMHLSQAGEMVIRVWDDLTVRYPAVALDEFVVMPNHVHGIVIVGALFVGAQQMAGIKPAISADDVTVRAGTRPAPTLSEIIGTFKSITTKEYTVGVAQNGWAPFHQRLWQRNYYEHIIRNEDDLNQIREYIQTNPLNWDHDENNPRILQEAQSI